MKNALAIFTKAPIAGQVKTRLCPPLSFAAAAELYRCFLLDTIERACTLPDVQVCLAFTPVESEPIFRKLLPFPLLYVPQRGPSLGAREANVFVDLLAQGFSRVVILGSDIPTLPVSHLQNAFALLEDAQPDVVIGPSADGGYYLLGARALHPALFEGIAWSTPTVFVETLAQARRVELRVAQVPAWYDVDEPGDLRQLAEELATSGGDERAPKTSAFLARLRFLHR